MAFRSRRGWQGNIQDDVGHHLAQLRREVASLSRSAGRYGNHLQHDLGEAVVRQGGALARELGHQAMKAGRAVQHDPVPALVATIGIACLARLMIGRLR